MGSREVWYCSRSLTCCAFRRTSLALRSWRCRDRVPVARAIVNGMEVTARDVEEMPRHCIHVSRDEFAEVWRTAEAQLSVDGWPPPDWFVIGVVRTCRWLAGLSFVAPASRRSPESVIPEQVGAEALEASRPNPPARFGDGDGPGCMVGVSATFAWAWDRTGPSPIEEAQRRHISR